MQSPLLVSIDQMRSFLRECAEGDDPNLVYKATLLLDTTNWSGLRGKASNPELDKQDRAQGIIDDVVLCTGIDRDVLLAPSAKKPGRPGCVGNRDETVAARRFAIYLLREEGLSFPVIGRIMHRDHSTIQYTNRRFRKLMKDGDFDTWGLIRAHERLTASGSDQTKLL